MKQFLQMTLAGQTPEATRGRTAQLSWQWHGHGLLELQPHQPPLRDLVLSAAILGDEAAPVVLLVTLLGGLLSRRGSPPGRLLACLFSPNLHRPGQGLGDETE